MSKFARGIFAALEDDDMMDSLDGEGNAELESASADIESDGRDIEDGVEALEDAMNDADTLEDIGDVMGDSVENGEGLSEDAAQIAEVAVESIYRRLGIRRAKAMPSMESFGSSSSRVHATRVAMEGIGDWVKETWAKIVQFFKDLWEKISNFFRKALAGIGQLKSAAQALKKKASGLSSKAAPFQMSFENAELGNAFPGGTLLNVDLRVKGAANTVEGLLEAAKKFEEIRKAAKDFSSKLAKALTDAKKDDQIDIGMDSDKMSLGTSNIKGKINDVDAYGPNKFTVSLEQGNEGDDHTVPRIRFEIVEKDATKTKEVVDVLQKADIIAIADSVEKLADEMEKVIKNDKYFKGAEKDVDEVGKILIKAHEHNGGDKVSDKKKDTSKEIKILKNALMGSGNSLMKLSSMVISNGVKVGKAAIKYGYASLKFYKDKAE